MKNIDITEYIVQKELMKMQEKSMLNTWATDKKRRQEEDETMRKQQISNLSREEEVALEQTVKYLTQQGYEFYKPNYFQKREGEIDIALYYLLKNIKSKSSLVNAT